MSCQFACAPAFAAGGALPATSRPGPNWAHRAWHQVHHVSGQAGAHQQNIGRMHPRSFSLLLGGFMVLLPYCSYISLS